MNLIKNMFDNLAKDYEFMNSIISFGTHKIIKKEAIKALNIQPNSKVLDLCCGTGDLAGLIKNLHPTCDVTGIDFSMQMLEIGRKKHPNVTFWQADALNLAFEKNTFDYIVMGFGLRNIPEKNKALEQIYKILKVNGKFLHLDFGKQNTVYSRIYDNIVLYLARIFTKNSKPYKYLILSKKNFLEPEELIELFKFNRFEYVTHKNLLFEIISYQIMQKK